MNRGSVYRRASVILVISLVAIVASLATPARASECTLADHIRSANTNTAVGFCPTGTSHDIITIKEDITLSEALPPITGTITIEGGGHTISGDGKFRIFEVSGGNLTIKSATLAKGRTVLDGGAIYLHGGGTLTAQQVIFQDNHADWGGAIAVKSASAQLRVTQSSFVGNYAEIGGGAVAVEGGAADINSSIFRQNETRFNGGALDVFRGAVSVSNSTFHRNTAARGGAIHVGGASTVLTHLTLFHNMAHVEGDSLYKREGTLGVRNSIIQGRPGSNCGGELDESTGNFGADWTCGEDARGDAKLAILNSETLVLHPQDGSPALDAADSRYCLAADQVGTLRPQGGGCDIGAIESTEAQPAQPPIIPPPPCFLSDNIIAANSDSPAGGCPAGNGADVIYLEKDVTLSEPLPPITSEITIDGRGHTISGHGRFRVFDVSGGRLTIKNLIVTRGKTPQNVSGAGVLVRNGGALEVENSSFIKNRSGHRGGAIMLERWSAGLRITDSSFFRNSAWDGGAIASAMAGYKPITIANSSFDKNRSVHHGGALHVGNSVSLTITNSTFNRNQSRFSAAALSLTGSSRVTLTHVTMIMPNSAPEDGTFIVRYNDAGGWLRLRNSIISGGHERHCQGGLTENIGNLIADGSCMSRANGDPMLADLDGTGLYYALQAGSPAIDAADPQYCLATDQVGRTRPQGGGCDIGAIEFVPGASDSQAAAASQ